MRCESIVFKKFVAQKFTVLAFSIYILLESCNKKFKLRRNVILEMYFLPQ